MSFMAYWNGAYSGTSSNLTYCAQGTIIGSKNIGSQSVNFATSSGSCSGNAATATKLATARTITLTGSVTGSVSIDGSANVTLATTTNHTHNFDSITSKPTTIGGYGITDAYTKTETNTKLSGYLPLTGGTIDGKLQIGANDNTSYKYLMLVRNSHFIRINNTDLNAHFTFGTMSDTGSLTAERILTLGDNGLRFSPNNSVYYDILHSGNYNAYSPKLDGTGATGT